MALLSAKDEVILARRVEADAFARERLTSGVDLRRTERRGLEHVVREGDEARERMILATRLVTKIARSFLPRAGSMQFDDLQQAGPGSPRPDAGGPESFAADQRTQWAVEMGHHPRGRVHPALEALGSARAVEGTAPAEKEDR